MADRTKIEWTDATWNPVTGCSRVSTGCENCYAERLVTLRRAELLLQYISDNWPEGIDWPSYIDRPKPARRRNKKAE